MSASEMKSVSPSLDDCPVSPPEHPCDAGALCVNKSLTELAIFLYPDKCGGSRWIARGLPKATYKLAPGECRFLQFDKKPFQLRVFTAGQPLGDPRVISSPLQLTFGEDGLKISPLDPILDEEKRGFEMIVRESHILDNWESYDLNFYELLQIESNATHEQIASAFRKAMRKYHPDKQFANSENEVALAGFTSQRLAKAKETLLDPHLRVKYDRYLRFKGSYWGRFKLRFTTIGGSCDWHEIGRWTMCAVSVVGGGVIIGVSSGLAVPAYIVLGAVGGGLVGGGINGVVGQCGMDSIVNNSSATFWRSVGLGVAGGVACGGLSSVITCGIVGVGAVAEASVSAGVQAANGAACGAVDGLVFNAIDGFGSGRFQRMSASEVAKQLTISMSAGALGGACLGGISGALNYQVPAAIEKKYVVEGLSSQALQAQMGVFLANQPTLSGVRKFFTSMGQLLAKKPVQILIKNGLPALASLTILAELQPDNTPLLDVKSDAQVDSVELMELQAGSSLLDMKSKAPTLQNEREAAPEKVDSVLAEGVVGAVSVDADEQRASCHIFSLCSGLMWLDAILHIEYWEETISSPQTLRTPPSPPQTLTVPAGAKASVPLTATSIRVRVKLTGKLKRTRDFILEKVEKKAPEGSFVWAWQRPKAGTAGGWPAVKRQEEFIYHPSNSQPRIYRHYFLAGSHFPGYEAVTRVIDENGLTVDE